MCAHKCEFTLLPVVDTRNARRARSGIGHIIHFLFLFYEDFGMLSPLTVLAIIAMRRPSEKVIVCSRAIRPRTDMDLSVGDHHYIAFHYVHFC